MLEIIILSVCVLSLFFNLAIAASVAKMAKKLEEAQNEPPIGYVNRDGGLQPLQDERGSRWGLHIPYDLPNYDGTKPLPKNFDGVGDSIINHRE